MKVYVIQKRSDGISTACYKNIEVHSDQRKAMKIMLQMNLTPLNFKNKEQFLDLEFQYYGKVEKIASNRKVSNYYRIQAMEVK